MKVNKRILLIGVLLGLITVLLLSNYINNIEREQEVSTTKYVDVVVAENTIPEHVTITEEMVTLASIPEDGLHPDAMTSLDDVIGGTSRTEIINGEQILSGRIVTEDIPSSFSYSIPSSMRAITIPINEVSGVGHHISVGDKVDILVSYTLEEEEDQADEDEEGEAPPDSPSGTTIFTQLQNIEVLALGQVTSSSSEEGEGTSQSSTMTILVTPEQAEVIAYANISGQTHLTLRNPVDDEIYELDHYGDTNFETFRQR